VKEERRILRKKDQNMASGGKEDGFEGGAVCEKERAESIRGGAVVACSVTGRTGPVGHSLAQSESGVWEQGRNTWARRGDGGMPRPTFIRFSAVRMQPL